MSVAEKLVAENMQLREQVRVLEATLEQVSDRDVGRWRDAGTFLATVYRHLALSLPGEWKATGHELGWTPEQIALAEVLASATRQELYAKAREYDDEDE
ncbi:MAG TPA: hypothetical protein VFA10_17945 [Ktedonobacteraceae bacterium]|nr:hypothetical protein [Ktedonobacteraceae bacterium]